MYVKLVLLHTMWCPRTSNSTPRSLLDKDEGAPKHKEGLCKEAHSSIAWKSKTRANNLEIQ